MRNWKRLAVGMVALLASVVGVEVFASPANAATYSVSGNVNWTNFYEICTSGCSASSGNEVRLWQQILFAQYGNQLGGDSGCNSFVDGSFGPNTTTWTKKWQHDFLDPNNLHPEYEDGRVGPQTWGMARSFSQYLGNPAPYPNYNSAWAWRIFGLTFSSNTWSFTKCSWLPSD